MASNIAVSHDIQVVMCAFGFPAAQNTSAFKTYMCYFAPHDNKPAKLVSHSAVFVLCAGVEGFKVPGDTHPCGQHTDR
jgi:hypothetical protein